MAFTKHSILIYCFYFGISLAAGQSPTWIVLGKLPGRKAGFCGGTKVGGCLRCDVGMKVKVNWSGGETGPVAAPVLFFCLGFTGGEEDMLIWVREMETMGPFVEEGV